MAAAVWDALAAGEMLAVEAGTGVGKTFAYLLPALRLGGRTLVCTGTRHLQISCTAATCRSRCARSASRARSAC